MYRLGIGYPPPNDLSDDRMQSKRRTHCQSVAVVLRLLLRAHSSVQKSIVITYLISPLFFNVFHRD